MQLKCGCLKLQRLVSVEVVAMRAGWADLDLLLTPEVSRSKALPVGQSKQEAKDVSTRHSYVHALIAAKLHYFNDGAFSKRMHRFGESH
jgi:hypothetical protein